MDRVLEFAAYALIVLGALVLLAMFVGRWIRKIGPSTEEREAIGSDICKDGVHPDECPSCRPTSVPGRVSADDIQFFASLARMEDELESITEGAYRLPGERAS